MKPSQKTLKRKADNLAGDWFRRTDKCCAKGFWGHSCSRRIEWAHITSRGVLCLRHSPLNALPLCNVCHRRFTMHPLQFAGFIDEWFPTRRGQLEAREKEAMDNHEKPDYQYWIDWYSNRPKDEDFYKWLRKGATV